MVAQCVWICSACSALRRTSGYPRRAELQRMTNSTSQTCAGATSEAFMSTIHFRSVGTILTVSSAINRTIVDCRVCNKASNRWVLSLKTRHESNFHTCCAPQHSQYHRHKSHVVLHKEVQRLTSQHLLRTHEEKKEKKNFDTAAVIAPEVLWPRSSATTSGSTCVVDFGVTEKCTEAAMFGYYSRRKVFEPLPL